ncbi:MAG: NADP-dependent oxidoreductase [Acetobacteraceae bacterium]
MSTTTPLPAQIMALRVHQFGPPNVLTLESIERPQPGPGEVLVKVAAAGVGPWDGWIRAGKSVLPQPLPLTLGSDLSGIVVDVGPGVTAFRAGDAVFGVTNAQFTGAQAEYAVAKADMIALQPSGMDNIEAASLPVIAITAWQALFERADLQRGQTVLIHGAAGNVGALAVQLGKQAGLTILATASAKDVDYVRCQGAKTVIDYRSRRFEDVAHDVDAVIDLVGGDTQLRSFSVLKPGGVLVSAVSQPDQARARQMNVRAEFFLVEVTTARLQHIAALWSQGALRASVGTELPLAAARSAHEMLEEVRPHPRGKIVLRIG